MTRGVNRSISPRTTVMAQIANGHKRRITGKKKRNRLIYFARFHSPFPLKLSQVGFQKPKNTETYVSVYNMLTTSSNPLRLLRSKKQGAILSQTAIIINNVRTTPYSLPHSIPLSPHKKQKPTSDMRRRGFKLFHISLHVNCVLRCKF